MSNEQQTSKTSDVERHMGKVSDGYHTFDELYDHRCHLFVALMRSHPSISWRANNHDDGSSYENWFIGGMHLPTGDISYHMPVRMWELLDGLGIATSLRAPKWDGHTSADVVKRLAAWCSTAPETNSKCEHGNGACCEHCHIDPMGPL